MDQGITTDNWFSFAVSFFVTLLTHKEWIALAWVLVVVYAGTESFKRSYALTLPKVKRKKLLYFCAFLIGGLFSFLLWPESGVLPWYVPAMFAGPLSNFLHWLVLSLIEWKFPKLAGIITGNKGSG